MNIRRKVFSIGTSAALLASLLTAIAAPAAFAQTATVTGGGAINPGGPASAALTIAVTEDAVTDWGAGGTTAITLSDAAGVVGPITFSGTPTVTASGGPAPFACSAALNVAKTILTVTCTGGTNTRLDSFSITGLKVTAALGAAIGAVHADWAGTLSLGTTSATASGTLPAVTGNPVAQLVTVTMDAGSAPFAVTNTAAGYSKASVAGGAPELVSLTVVGAFGATQDVTGVFLLSHTVGTAISQTVLAARLPTLATVGDTTSITTCATPLGVRQGINNQAACNVIVDFGKAGFVALSSTITLTIASAGEQFSGLPTVTMSGPATLVLGAGVLSFDRKSITYTVTTKSTTDNDTATFSLIKLDVATTAAPGSTVDVNLSVAPTVSVVGNPASIAQVGSTLVGAASVPTVLIGYNDQPTGTFSFRETAAGTLTTDIGGGFDLFGLCLRSGENFSRAPWAVVTAGDLKLNVGGLPVAQARGTVTNGVTTGTGPNSCAYWTIYSASTVPSTVEIRGGVDAASTAPLGAGAANGPKINVPVGLFPGPVRVQGYQDFTGAGANFPWFLSSPIGPEVVVAMRVFSGSPVVKALGQPIIIRSTQQAGAPITIEETFAGQFGLDEEIELCLVPRSMTNQQDVYYSTSFYDTSSPFTANQPIITTNNETGLVASFEAFETSTSGAGPGIGYDCLEVHIDAAPVVGLGKITVSNIRYDVVADAPFGPVQLNVYRESSGEFDDIVAGANFNQTVSNATIGTKTPVAMTNGSSLGYTKIGPFTSATKVAALGKYVTWKFAGGAALAGKTVEIQVATRGAFAWSSFTTLTKRVADASGNVYFWLKKSSATWISVRAYYPGDDSAAPSWSAARQARWR